MLKAIKKFFTPYKWKTIWRGSLSARMRNNLTGVESRDRISMTAVVQVDDYKNQFRCYATDGVNRHKMEIDHLIELFPEIVKLLDSHNIAY